MTASGAGDGVPELVPARMLNEFVYCPRLFYLEWVNAQFEDSADTVDGRYKHRVVDTQGGSAPLPGEGDIVATRSLLLSSPRLGLVARVDCVEGARGAVRPLDVKRGRPPETPHRSWDPERVQLCVSGLLLRETGYRCEEGILYFAEARRRVVVAFDDELVGQTMALLDDLRAVASRNSAPPPLIDSPKCPRCSLVGICLPDEVNTLAARSERPPRRLTPRDPSGRPLYVTMQGTTAGHRDNRVEVTSKGDTLSSVRLIDVSQLCVYGNVQVTTQLLTVLFAREIPVCWFSFGGWFRGIAEGLPSKHVELRRRQVALAHRGSVAIACRMVEGKIRNSRTLLRRNSRTPPRAALMSLRDLADRAATADSSSSLLGLEGAAARVYFAAFPNLLRAEESLPGGGFDFDGRNRRPPLDAVNCLLSFVYGLLTKDLTVTALAVGFDPYLGFLHRPRFGRPALALDIAEEFRPIVAESVVINLINNGEVGTNDFVVRSGGVSLTSAGRRTVLLAYERRLDTEVQHPLFRYRAPYRRILEVQTRLLAAHVIGEAPEYVPFMTR